MSETSAAAPSEFRHHGKLLIPCLAGIFLVSIHGYSLGVMIVPLEREFGWTRAQITAGPTIIAMISFVLAPIIGTAIDRLGPRPVAILGVSLYGLFLMLVATADSDIWSWWLRWAVLGLASSIILPTVWAAAINTVFDVHRGKALAVALLGTGIAAAIVPSLTSALLGQLGWRLTYVVLALGGSSLVLLLVLTLFRVPRALVPLGETTTDGALSSGLAAREGFRSPAFIKLAVAVFVFGVTSLALTVNAVPVLEARGFSIAAAAGLAGLLGIGSILGRLGGGFLLDRFEARKIAAIATLAPIASIGLLMVAPGDSILSGLAMLVMGLALGSEVDACSYLAARHFGMRSFGALFGSINGVVALGAGIAPMLGNYVYDLTGTYDPVLWTTIPLCLLSTLLFLSLGAYPVFDSPSVSDVNEIPPLGAVLA